MNLTSIKPHNLIAAAALIAPIAIVQTTRLLFGSGPPSATAAAPADTEPNGQAPPTAPPVQAALAPKQKAAVEHLRALRSTIPVYASPFNHLVPQSTAVMQAPTQTPEGETIPIQPVAVIPTELRSLTIGAMMRNDLGPFALINGRARAVGEVILTGWTVTEIDLAGRRVAITSDDGQTVYLVQPN